MGLWDSLIGRIKLTETNRARITALFGSFDVNMFAMKGPKLLENSYESNADVYSILRKIIDVSKSLPWVVEQKQRDGTWMIIEDTPIHELMSAPNVGKGYTWNDIEEQVLLYLLACGNSYMVGEQAVGFSGIQEVDVLPPFATTIKSTDNFFMPAKTYQFQLGRTNRTFLNEQIEHIKFFNPGYDSVEDSLYGLSPVQVAAKAIQVSNDRWEADASLMQNRGAIGLLTDKSNRPMKNDEAEKVQESFDRDMVGARRFGKIKVTNKALDYIQMAMSSTDLQLLEKGVVNLRSMCNVWGLDSSLFNDPANKTFNNRKEAEKSMFTNAVMPLSWKIASAHTNFIAKAFYPDGSVRMRQEFDRVEALQTDKKEEAEKDKIVIDGIGMIMRMNITPEAKSKMLVDFYEFTEDDAKITSQGSTSGVDNLGKIPLALQQLALARERAQANGDQPLVQSIGTAMDILTAQLITQAIQ